MIDFDKMTVAEHEQYKEMERKAELADSVKQAYDLYLISGNPDLFVEQVVEVMRK